MKIEPGKSYKTRGGQKVRIVCTDVKCLTYQILGLLASEDGEVVESFTRDGRFHEGVEGSDADIIGEWQEPLVLYAVLDEFGNWLETCDLAADAQSYCDAETSGGRVVKLVEAQE